MGGVRLLVPEERGAAASGVRAQGGDRARCDLWFLAEGPGREWGAAPVPGAGGGLVVFALPRGQDDPTRSTSDLLAGLRSLLGVQLGAVPRRLVWDNEAGIRRRNRLADGGRALLRDAHDADSAAEAVRPGLQWHRRVREQVPEDNILLVQDADSGTRWTSTLRWRNGSSWPTGGSSARSALRPCDLGRSAHGEF